MSSDTTSIIDINIGDSEGDIDLVGNIQNISTLNRDSQTIYESNNTINNTTETDNLVDGGKVSEVEFTKYSVDDGKVSEVDNTKIDTSKKWYITAFIISLILSLLYYRRIYIKRILKRYI